MVAELMARVRSLLRGVVRTRRVNADLNEEFRLHIELRSADLVLCVAGPSLAGPLPLEAMACGVPVVAASRTTVDTVVDGVTGRHVEFQHPADIAHVVRQLLADRLRRESYGIAGRDRALACYSWQHVAVEAVRAYERATTNPGT